MKPINYMLKRWTDFARFLDDGRICLSTDGVEKRKSSTPRPFLYRWRFGARRFCCPCRHHSLVSLLGSRHVLVFPLADFLDPVVVTRSRFAVFARSASLERDFPQFHGRERRPRKRVLFLFRQYMPNSTCQIITTSLRAVATAAAGAPRVRRTRSKKARNGPGASFADHAASTSIFRA